MARPVCLFEGGSLKDRSKTAVRVTYLEKCAPPLLQRYQFADTRPDDVENATNRSPWPTLHLLLEASIERATDAMSDPGEIYRRNIETLRKLGSAGWDALDVEAPG